MRAVHLAGCGLVSALGPDLDAAMHALARGDVAPQRVQLAPGFEWPLFRIADASGDWQADAQRWIRAAAGASGALDGPREGPLFIASSSLDIGQLERVGAAYDDYQVFGDRVASWLDWRGPVFTVATACTSAINALLAAHAMLAAGDADEAVVLGLELPNRVTIGGFGAMQLLAPEAARPLAADRQGLVLGEAVAALRLTSQAARWRIAGGANVVDGRDPAGTVPEAVVAMCERALASAGVTASDIALMKPQAAGGIASDATEIAALRRVFDPLPPLVSFKAAIGHTLGAAGAAELALLTRCLETSTWPQATHAPDPALDAKLATHAPTSPRHLLASILGFGGGHAAVVLEDMEAAR
jgi:3-oxoacyl-[acyl-carrier-protein] synthase-1